MNTFIFGHRNPDTDSICSAIALSYLKNMIGEKTIAKAAGHLNNETKFVLNYFNVPEPQYLNDVKVRIKNIKYKKKAYVYEKSTIYDAYTVMQSQSVTAIPLVDEHKKLSGFISMKDLAKFLVSCSKEIIDTSLENILNVLNAEVITQYDEYIQGKMMLVGYQSSTFHEEIKLTNEDILIIGDRYKVIEYAIESKVKLIVLALNNVLSKDLVKKAEENNVTIIRTKLTSFEIANKISLSNYIYSIKTCDNPVTTFDDDFYDEFQILARKTKHTNYPVINHKNECLGLISLNGINEFQRQRVILVDHNNFEQSVIGIEEAIILEIIDHHNLGRVGTKVPINFRSMPVGCTATIIYKMFLEKKVRIPKNIAGLLLSAIISDTLLFTSPSTTREDVDAAEKLAKLAKVKIKDYGHKMLKASSSIDGLTINEQLYQDYKSYTVGKLHIGISQLITMDFDEIYNNKEEYIEKLDSMYELSPGVNALFITDVIKKGSYVFYNTKSSEIIRDAFNLKDIKQGMFIPNVISRKKQMLPALMDILEKQ